MTKQSTRQRILAAAVASSTNEPVQTLRLTRQRSGQTTAAAAADPSPTCSEILSKAPRPSVTSAVPANSLRSTSIVTILPPVLTPESTGLGMADLGLLDVKQSLLLRQSRFQAWLGSSTSKAKLASAAHATSVFAQAEAGTAVCISPQGLLLTCSHCVAESAEELARPESKSKMLLFASGRIVLAECIAWDPKRDLALLQIAAAQPEPLVGDSHFLSSSDAHAGVSVSRYPFVPVAQVPPPLRRALICIGHPGSEDLEVSTPGVQTGYDVLHISSGLFRGYAVDQDLQDNSEIGALKHVCWTYWGHSGAPLVEQATGCLVGLHSSWDETSGMRHGVPLEAIQQFLREHTTNTVLPGQLATFDAHPQCSTAQQSRLLNLEDL